LDECFLTVMVDYLNMFLDFGMVFYSYAIILFQVKDCCDRMYVGSIREYTPTIVFIILCFMLLVKQGFSKRSIRAYTLLA
jgi:hypothetical protein